MTPETPEFRIRRLLVALDASPQSLAALEAAADLAARADADVHGLFVEDVDLLRLAGRAAAQVVDAASAALRMTDLAEMERTLHALAVRAERALAEAAGRGRVRSSFRVARGRVAAEILAAAEETDVVCLGRSSWSGGRGARIGATARSVIAGAPGAVLLVAAADRPASLPVVLFDGSPQSLRALAAARAISRRDGGRIRVLLPPGDEALRAHLRREAEEVLRGSGVAAEFSVPRDASPESLAAALAAAGDAVLVVGRDAGGDAIPEERLHSLGARPLFLVR